MKPGKAVETVKRYCATCKKETETVDYQCMECLLDCRNELKGDWKK